MRSFWVYLPDIARRAIIYYVKDHIFRIEDESGRFWERKELPMKDLWVMDEAFMYELIANEKETNESNY